METARFTYYRMESGWRMKTDEPGLEGPLEGVFRYELRIGEVPVELPIVGHCRVLGLWCVFFRPAGSTTVSGAALRHDAYAAFGFDPYAAAAGLLGSDLTATAGEEPFADLESTGDRGRDYLRLAYRYFLTGDANVRQSLYCSVLPEGCPRRVSPLTCFVLEGGQLIADGLVEQLREAAGDRTGATPLVGDESPFQVEAATTAVASRAPTTQQPAAWFDQPLSRTAEAPAADRSEAAPSASGRPPAPAGAGPADELRAQLDQARIRGAQLARRTRLLGVALVVVAALLAGAITAGLVWTRRQVQRLEAGTVSKGLLSEGLGLKAGNRSVDDALRASLRDLATTSVQSGAWQEGLRGRGVTPDEFLDRLAALSAQKDALLALAQAQGALTRLAPHAEAVARLAGQEGTLLQLAAQAAPLATLAAQQPALSGVAERKADLDALVEARASLVALAGERQRVEELLAQAMTLTAEAREVANLITFMERRQRDLEELGARRSQLVGLAADQEALAALARDREALESLAKNRAALVELSRRSQELLKQLPPAKP